MNKLHRFLVVGFLNTFLGYGLFIIFLRVFLLSAAIANFLSYFLIIILSFSVYRKTVFRSSKKSNTSKPFYLMSFLLAFSLNQTVLYFFSIKTALPPEVYQVFAMTTYTLVFFYLNKKFVF